MDSDFVQKLQNVKLIIGLEQCIGTGFWKNVLSVCWGDFSQIGLLTNVLQRLYCNLCRKWVLMFILLMLEMVSSNLNFP